MQNPQKRSRERVPIEISGSGIVVGTGEAFSFQAVDFSGMGMMLKVAGTIATIGQFLKLDLEIVGVVEEGRPINLTGEVMWLGGEGQTLCGIQITEEVLPQDLEALDNLYMERFFDTME